MDPQLAAMLGALGGGGGGGGGGGAPMMSPAMLDGLWDMPMITSIAFHPRPEVAAHMGATSGPLRQGVFEVAGGDKVSYSLYLPEEGEVVKVVVFNFHGNAEVCTDIGMEAGLFHRVGAALLSIDYRGYAWGTGQPSLTKLCNDASNCFEAAGKVLSDAGIDDAKRVVMGRSIGATCAVHLAAMHAADVYGLVIDSGLMSIKELPMVASMAPMFLGPQAPAVFAQLKEPFDTYGKLAAISCPTLVMHGDRDQIVAVEQAVKCHERLACGDKKLRRWESAGHNDVLATNLQDWEAEVVELIPKKPWLSTTPSQRGRSWRPARPRRGPRAAHGPACWGRRERGASTWSCPAGRGC
ncbi:unnamed protein product [Prorocentrum cordatum]|uniref:Serine aminopeptidase S33 domain-containing protein n=1 Tax=Prorocentrum cordatum TaxID=2364126 RepID=A0ABN9RLH9_9DINO|nr:unnamed protein product [Polarella glacialis]